jgi:hypothetical protein
MQDEVGQWQSPHPDREQLHGILPFLSPFLDDGEEEERERERERGSVVLYVIGFHSRIIIDGEKEGKAAIPSCSW